MTVLFSRTQPLIRCEMSDSVAVSMASCPCGRPFALLAGVQGRSEETLHLPDATGVLIDVRPNAFHRVLETVEARGWQVAHGKRGIRVLLAGAAAAVDVASVEAKIRAALVETHAMPPPISVELVVAIHKTAI